MKKTDHFTIRFATRDDAALIVTLIKELAEYEQLLDEVTVSEATIVEWVFNRQKAEVLIGEEKGVPVGFALFFHNFSTFVGKSGLYLEDLYIRPEYRKKGYGKAFFIRLAAIAEERECGRFEWVCLDWNRNAINFYTTMGAIPMSDWTIYRIKGEDLNKVSTL